MKQTQIYWRSLCRTATLLQILSLQDPIFTEYELLYSLEKSTCSNNAFLKSYIREQWRPFKVTVNISNQIKTLSFDFVIVFQRRHLCSNFISDTPWAENATVNQVQLALFCLCTFFNTKCVQLIVWWPKNIFIDYFWHPNKFQ